MEYIELQLHQVGKLTLKLSHQVGNTQKIHYRECDKLNRDTLKHIVTLQSVHSRRFY